MIAGCSRQVQQSPLRPPGKSAAATAASVELASQPPATSSLDGKCYFYCHGQSKDKGKGVAKFGGWDIYSRSKGPLLTRVGAQRIGNLAVDATPTSTATVADCPAGPEEKVGIRAGALMPAGERAAKHG